MENNKAKTKIILANNFELPVIQVTIDKDYLDNVNRRVMYLQAPYGVVSLDELDKILSDTTNLAKFQHYNEKEGAIDIFENYYKVELSTKQMMVDEDKDGTPVMEPQIVVRLAAYTQDELNLRENNQRMAAILEKLAELGIAA